MVFWGGRKGRAGVVGQAEIKQLLIITMNAQIITQDLGDGYYHHQVNVSTYYYYESVVSPIALRESRAGSRALHPPTPSLGRFEPYRLSQFVSPADLAQEGRVVKLATVEKGKLVVDPQAIKIFQKYSDNEIAFVGNYGRRNSGKSYWYDKVLNLSDFDGNNYSSNRREPGLYFWSIPYTKDNLKFFLVDYAGFEGKDPLSPDEEKLLDFELLLCEKLVVVPEPDDEELKVLRPAYNHLLQSQRRFSDRGIQANKFSPYWPNEIYTLYRSTKPVKKEIDNIGVLFPVYNFSILHDALDPSQGNKDALQKTTLRTSPQNLNEKYVKMSSVVFKDIYEKMKGKEHGNVVFNGKNLPYIVEQSKSAINSGGPLKLDQVFDGVKGDIYDQTIQRCKLVYLRQLDPIRNDPEPKPLDVLTEAFDRGSTKAYKEFDKEVIDKKVHEQYEKKLQAEIDKIEQDVLKDNKQKTYEYYNKKLPVNQAANPALYFSQLKKGFKDQKSTKKLDHNDTQPIQERLEKLVGSDPEEISVLPFTKHKEETLKKQISLKSKELESVRLQKSGLKGGKDQGQGNLLADKHEVLISKVSQLKQELEDKKATDQLTPQQKEFLLTTLREAHSKNQSKLNEIKATPHKEDEINQLKDKLRKVATKNTVIQNSILRGDKSQLEKSLPDKSADKSFASNRSVRSVIRDIKSENIKKITPK